MDLKQEQIESIVTEYFRQRRDADVYPTAGGVYEVKLNSEIAQADFHGKSTLRLIFDGERAYENPDSELITANHSYLDIIRNDLERNPEEDVRLGEAYLPAQLVNLEGALVIPQLEISSKAGRLDYNIRYRATFVLTYRIDYETDDRSENVVRLCYDAMTGATQPELVPLLRGLYPLGGPPPTGVTDGLVDLAGVLEGARREIESRVTFDTRGIGQQLLGQLDIEKKRLQDHYNSEMELARDEVTRQQVLENLSKDIGEQERKLTCRVHVRLVSVLRLWWPVVDYSLTIPSMRGNFEVTGIHYDLQSEQTQFIACDRCGNQSQYSVCVVEKHLVCAVCEKHISQCDTCAEDYCTQHGGLCRKCSRPNCRHDGQHCSYGSHASNEFFCSKCLVKSFEGRSLCGECQELCDLCHRPFPHELMAKCRIGQENICQGHGASPDGYRCNECRQVACSNHAVHTAEETWACRDHVGVASCCRRTFGHSRLVGCTVEKGETLCPAHRRECLSCGQAACSTHSSPLARHSGAFVCDKCRHTCVMCESKKSYQATDLLLCQTCKREVCESHRKVCVVGNEVLCDTDVHSSIDGEPLCKLHARSCVQCGSTPGRPIHRADKMQFCPVCKGEVCEQHRFVCPTCRTKFLCHVHQPSQPICEGCGRLSCGDDCSSNSHLCGACGIAYCRHCSGSKNRCVTCSNLRDTVPNDYMLKLLQKTPTMVQRDVASMVRSIVTARAQQLTFASGFNQTYQILEVHYRPRFYEMWKTGQKLHVVATIHGEIKRVTVRAFEKVG